MKDEFETQLKAGELIEWINSIIYSEFEQAQEVIVAAHVAGSIDLWEMLSELDTSEMSRRASGNWSRLFQSAMQGVDCDVSHTFSLSTHLMEAFDDLGRHSIQGGFSVLHAN